MVGLQQRVICDLVQAKRTKRLAHPGGRQPSVEVSQRGFFLSAVQHHDVIGKSIWPFASIAKPANRDIRRSVSMRISTACLFLALAWPPLATAQDQVDLYCGDQNCYDGKR